MKYHRGLFSGANVDSPIVHAGLAILRVFAGLSLALAHGIGKVPPSSRFIETVGRMGFPSPEWFAWIAGISELFGGIFLAVGWLTRPSSLFIALTMFVAAFIRHAEDPYVTKEKALLFGVVSLFFFIVGSGSYGVDAFIRKRDK